MSDPVTIVECPRDAWQGLSAHIPAQRKAEYLRKLIGAGFTRIDAVSFVSPSVVPQMADSEEVLALLDPPAHVEIIGIVVNQKGVGRAVATGAVKTLGFPYSISSTFLDRNQNQTPKDAMTSLRAIQERAHDANLNLIAYLSMAFGNPYGDAWSTDTVLDACSSLIEVGIRQISLADTVGAASEGQIAEVVSAALAGHREIEIGVHLHARGEQAATHIRAAYTAGCRRFDAAIGGLGGCPFAQDALVGNIPTEVLIEELTRLGAALPSIGPLDELIDSSAEFARLNIQ